jgi:hypothetical protein
MRIRLWLAAAVLVALTAPAMADRRSDAKAYDTALKLDHANQFIRSNYEQFFDIYQRTLRRVR